MEKFFCATLNGIISWS